MGSAVGVAAAGAWLLRRRGWRAPLTGELVTWSDVPIRREHVIGGAIFGVGWAVSSSGCPGVRDPHCLNCLRSSIVRS
jgi:uncharacterized membrane protein YedE/YeeE